MGSLLVEAAWRYVLVALTLIFALAYTTSCWAYLVFSALSQGTWGVYLQANHTSTPKPVMEAVDGDGSAPALAPDQRRVAFEVQGTEIHVCSLGSSSKCQVVRPERGAAVRPAWHPVTGDLLFVRYLADEHGEDSDIFITRSSLSRTEKLLTQTGIQDYPDVSPDGRFLVSTSSQKVLIHRGATQVIQQLWIMDLETGVARQLLLGTAQDIHPDWSPSGQKIAFSSNRSGQFEIWVVHTDGSGLRRVTNGPGAKTWPAWSPDGRSIMFTLAKDGRQRLWLIGVDGSNLRPFEPFSPGADVELKDADWR